MVLHILRIYSLLLAIPAVFALAAWFAYRRYRLPGLAVLWTACSAAYGYLSFQAVCSRPVTCDVGSDPYSVAYLTSVAPPFALAAAIAFGAVSLVVLLRSQRAPQGQLRISDLTLSTLAGVAGFIVAAPILRTPIW